MVEREILNYYFFVNNYLELAARVNYIFNILVF